MANRHLKTETTASSAVHFDIDAARSVTESFALTSGTPCTLYAKDGTVLRSICPGTDACDTCRRLAEITGTQISCENLHSYGAFQSERFGGRYIYFCPAGFAFFASPILMGGIFDGALVGGPIRIVDDDDFLANDALRLNELSPEISASIRESLLAAPQREPRILDRLSEQLFADAVYIGDSSHELFRKREENEQQNLLGDYIARLKMTEKPVAYPVDKEHDLYLAISKGDKATASILLNELLGYIYFYSPDSDVIRTRITELLVILSRAAILGGANAEQILSISQEYMQDMRVIHTQEELTRWLAASLNRFTDLVFTMLDVKHSNAMNAAVNYIKAHYGEKLTLEETAKAAGYAPSYFSRIFREEMGCTFKDYLAEYRIERSKHLLISGNDSISDICSVVGFPDQSYFTKIFRQYTGTTPDKFRKRTRRIDAEKEFGGI